MHLATIRTRLANQRTYLAYMRTGFAISAIAGTFKKFYLALFGVIMILISTYQYYLLNLQLEQEPLFDRTPLIYSILSLIVLSLQYLHK